MASSVCDFSISGAHNQGLSSGYSPGRKKIAEMLEAMEEAHLSYGVYDSSQSIQKSRLRGFKEYPVTFMGVSHGMAMTYGYIAGQARRHRS